MPEKEKSQIELLERKITMSEIKHAVDGVSKRLDIKEEINKSEDVIIEVIQNKQKK